jgi:hypothetical protein
LSWNAVHESPDARSAIRHDAQAARPPLVIGCGALASELVALTRRAGLPAMDLTCLPASLHNRPEQIPAAVARRIRRARVDGYDRIFVAYADCGTGGMLDRVLEAEGVARLEGAHCYEVYAGRAAFAALQDAEPGTFYLTDFLARNFERLVVRGLGLDRHPELLPLYFGNYRRLVYLAQADDPGLTEAAERAAHTLGLAFERRLVGLGELAPAISAFATDARASHTRTLREAPVRTLETSASAVFRDSQTRFIARRPRSGPHRLGFVSTRHESSGERGNQGRSGAAPSVNVSGRQGRAAARAGTRATNAGAA